MSEPLENNMKGISATCFTGQQFRLSTDQLEEFDVTKKNQTGWHLCKWI